MPRGNTILVERDDDAMKRFAQNNSPLLAPAVVMEHGVSASGAADPYNTGHNGAARTRDSVTVLYSRVVRVGGGVKDPELARGAVVCFSPSYSCCRLERSVRGADGTLQKKYYALVDADEVFFVAGD